VEAIRSTVVVELDCLAEIREFQTTAEAPTWLVGCVNFVVDVEESLR
jgi:hypothetical protein